MSLWQPNRTGHHQCPGLCPKSHANRLAQAQSSKTALETPWPDCGASEPHITLWLAIRVRDHFD